MSYFQDLRRRFRLRQLQRAYYEGSQKDDALIAEYLRLLQDARENYLRRMPEERPLVALHVGSGGHYIRGWVNIDLDITTTIDVGANVGETMPFRSGSVDYIHSEDFLEHMDLDSGKRFLAETFRVLKCGGVMRLLTPDLRALVERVYLNRETRHLEWCRAYLDADGPCEALNMHLRMRGDHRFIYDEEYLRALLHSIGFRTRRVRYNWSPEPHLRFLDLRDFGLNLFLECVKPQDPL